MLFFLIGVELFQGYEQLALNISELIYLLLLLQDPGLIGLMLLITVCDGQQIRLLGVEMLFDPLCDLHVLLLDELDIFFLSELHHLVLLSKVEDELADLLLLYQQVLDLLVEFLAHHLDVEGGQLSLLLLASLHEELGLLGERLDLELLVINALLQLKHP